MKWLLSSRCLKISKEMIKIGIRWTMMRTTTTRMVLPKIF